MAMDDIGTVSYPGEESFVNNPQGYTAFLDRVPGLESRPGRLSSTIF